MSLNSNPNNNDLNHCAKCKVQFGLLTHKHHCPDCSLLFCSKCIDFAVVTEEESKKGDKGIGHLFCESCFIKNNALDFTKTEEFIGTEVGKQPALVFVHGGGGCRNMFIQHARIISKDLNVNCICLDLPGHGSRMNDPLSLETAINVILETTLKFAPECDGKKPILCGGSLGGAIAMEMIGTHPDVYSGAIITMAGQNGGVGRSWMASLGLTFLELVTGNLSAKTLLHAMWGEAIKNGHLPNVRLMETSLRCGFFFHQSAAQVKILRDVDTATSLKKYSNGKVLFINGSADYRDSEDRWLECIGKERGKLIVYDQANHFFSHDDRFFDRFVKDISDFAKDCWKM